MNFYKLTISKVIDRKGLAAALKNIFYTLSIRECLNITDNLPFIHNEMLMKESDIINILTPHCDFSYTEIIISENNNSEYTEAINWFNNLSEDEKKKVNVLIRGSMPSA